jgi:hypothetical protein
MKTQQSIFDQCYPNIDDFDINKFGLVNSNQNLVLIDSHTDDWVDIYIQQQLDCPTQYFHKRTLHFNILGNWDINRNKKDMKYNTNTCNHIWTWGTKSKTQIETILNKIRGKTIYAVWNFDYLYQTTIINKELSYTINFITFNTKKAATEYLNKWLDDLSVENDKRKMWEILQKGRACDMFVLQHKPFRSIHKIEIPAKLYVMSLNDFINEVKDFYKPHFNDLYNYAVTKDLDFHKDLLNYRKRTKKEIDDYWDNVYGQALGWAFTYDKKMIQKVTPNFRKYIEQKYG